MPTIATGSVLLDIKYIFLSFAQQYFATISKYLWNADVRTSNILIMDKNAIDLGVAVRKPSIVLSRGSAAWSYANRGQIGINSDFNYKSNLETLDGVLGSGTPETNQTYTDMLRGSVTFNVLSKSGIVAEEIAAILFNALTAERAKLKETGVHQITAMGIGEEQNLKTTSEIEVSLVPLSLSFLLQKSVKVGQRQFNCHVYIDSTEVHEGIHFRVGPEGTTVIFETAPAIGEVLTITYVEAVTLEQRTLVSFVETPDGDITTFTVPDGEAIYGYYKLFEKALINISNEEATIDQDLQVGE